MLKRFKDKKKNNKGFTLVELVVVVAILAILVGLLAPQYTKYVEKARKSSDASNLENMVRAIEVAIAETDETKVLGADTYTITITDNGTTVTATPDTGNTNQAKAEAAIKEVIGTDFEKVTLKSKSWGDAGISAVIEVESSGAFTVAYNPDDLKNLIGKKTSTAKP